MRFSPQCVVFAATIENKSARARSLRISFALGVFGYCTFSTRKCQKSQVFRTVSAPGCLSPLQKLQLVS